DEIEPAARLRRDDDPHRLGGIGLRHGMRPEHGERSKEQEHAAAHFPGSSAVTSISTRSSGKASADTATVVAGMARGRNFARVWANTEMSLMFTRNVVILKMYCRSLPRSFRLWRI